MWRWTRRALAGLGGLLAAAAAAGATFEWLATRRDLARQPPPGRLVDVGGHRLHIWCTGSGPDFSWIDLPVFGENEHEPMHHRGVVANQPGLYFVGLSFLYAMSSGFLPGVDRDAEHIVHAILAGADRTSDRPGRAVDHGIRRPRRSG